MKATIKPVNFGNHNNLYINAYFGSRKNKVVTFKVNSFPDHNKAFIIGCSSSKVSIEYLNLPEMIACIYDELLEKYDVVLEKTIHKNIPTDELLKMYNLN